MSGAAMHAAAHLRRVDVILLYGSTEAWRRGSNRCSAAVPFGGTADTTVALLPFTYYENCGCA